MAAFPHHEWTSSQGVFSGSVSGVDMNNPAHRPCSMPAQVPHVCQVSESGPRGSYPCVADDAAPAGPDQALSLRPAAPGDAVSRTPVDGAAQEVSDDTDAPSGGSATSKPETV